MKKLFKWLGLSFGLIVTLAVLAGTWFWYAPLPNFDWALNRAFAKTVLDSPETLTQLHVLEQAGITFHQDDLDDESQAAGDEALARMKEIGVELRGYDRDELPYQQQLSYDMVDWLLTRMEDGVDKWRYYSYPLNQMSGVQSNFPSFMESAHAINSVGDAEDYNTRLSKLGVKFSQIMEGLKIREEKGILPPTFVVDKVLDEMVNFVGVPASENILQTSFKTKLEEAGISEADKAELMAENTRQIENSVYPAYQIFIDYYNEIRPKTTTDDGVWKLPRGDEFYAFMLQMMTTSEMAPGEIHELGLSEVARIQAEMLEILAAEGYDTTRPFGELMNEISEEDRFMYPDTDEGREQILADYKTILDEISGGLDDWFNIRPKAALDVERVPEFKEKNSAGAYYGRPAMDGSRPGIFYANLYDIKATPKLGMRTLAYHEGIPGHHFQIALAMEQKELPLFRKMGPFTAYIEGWALYSERVAWEAGFQEDPFSNLGRLQAELFRGVRLVVDTGIHHSRWTREQAIDYMLANTGLAKSDVVAEIERYIVMPGQACAYKVGMIEIMKLRALAEKTLGADFDVREFHDVILKNGAMPLTILNRVVNDWLTEKQTTQDH